MNRAKLMALTLLAWLLLVPNVSAEDEPGEAAFQYDGTNLAIETVIERATAAGKPIFLEFFTEG